MSGTPASVLITGASSGLGEALALHYARPGATLFLSGRDAGRLDSVARACAARGAEVESRVLTVTDEAAMAHWLAEAFARRPLDLVIANAGISGGTGGAEEPAEQARAIFDVNVAGVMNTVLPVIPLMRERGSGQIAIMSSLAGFRGFPGAPAYCASKAAVRVWGEGLRGWLAGDGVRVSVICPGFVKSRMTAVNTFPMPFLMEADEAARRMAEGLAADRGRIAFPRRLYAAVWLLAALPSGLVDWIGRRLPAKR